MLISKTITMEEDDVYAAIKDYIKKSLGIDPNKICSVTLDEDKTMARIIIQQEQVKS